jgi:hypothetical protein
MTSKTAMSASAMRDPQLEDLMLCIRVPRRGFVASPVVICALFQQRGPATLVPVPVP